MKIWVLTCFKRHLFWWYILDLTETSSNLGILDIYGFDYRHFQSFLLRITTQHWTIHLVVTPRWRMKFWQHEWAIFCILTAADFISSWWEIYFVNDLTFLLFICEIFIQTNENITVCYWEELFDCCHCGLFTFHKHNFCFQFEALGSKNAFRNF